jgi:hypothetical protein
MPRADGLPPALCVRFGPHSLGTAHTPTLGGWPYGRTFQAADAVRLKDLEHLFLQRTTGKAWRGQVGRQGLNNHAAAQMNTQHSM